MKKTILTITTLALIALPAQADWVPADGHKMHFPQLPDVDGWDVYAVDNVPDPSQRKMLADDWTCSQTGDVTDIHFWGSWRNGLEGNVQNFTVSIWDNIPVGPNNHSVPGALRWQGDFFIPPVEPIDPPAQQGWYNPNPPEVVIPQDHIAYFQYNLFLDQAQAFFQQEGEVYWLGVSANVVDPIGTAWGWKTADVERYPNPNTGFHYLDDAVWVDIPGGTGGVDPSQWNELTDPIGGQSLDLAFVITPEPSSAMLAILGAGLCLLRRRMR